MRSEAELIALSPTVEWMEQYRYLTASTASAASSLTINNNLMNGPQPINNPKLLCKYCSNNNRNMLTFWAHRSFTLMMLFLSKVPFS